MAVFRPAERVRRLPPNFWGAMDREIARVAGVPGVGGGDVGDVPVPVPVIDVSKGNPDQPTPEHIVAAMQRAVAEPRHHRYPPGGGLPALKDAVALRYRLDHGVSLDPATQVGVFHGSHEGIIAAVLGLADPGSAVVVPDPGYPIYRSAADLAQARVVELPLREADFQPSFEVLDGLDAASVLLLNYPNNPTGALATAATFEAAGAFARRTGAAFVHDFAYSSLGFDSAPLSALASDPGLEVAVELQTLSKTYSMAGWRIGFAAGNASIIAAMRAYQSHAFSSMFGAVQEAAAAALAGDQSAAADLVRLYERRRNLVVEGLRRIGARAGWHVADPEGTFFVWVRLPEGTDAVAFADRLLAEQRVAVAPGDGFGPRGAGHIRIGLVHDDAVLAEMIERLDAFVTAS